MLSKFEMLAHLFESISSPESRVGQAEGALLKGHKQKHRARRSRSLGQNCFLLGVTFFHPSEKLMMSYT